MIKIFTDLPEPLISSVSIMMGAVIGGVFSWIVTKKSTDKTIEVQNRIVEDNRKYAEDVRLKRSREYANIIRLDICTALFNSIRILKNSGGKKDIEIYPIPMDREYSGGVAYLKNDFGLKEMSYIYQLYGIIEKLNRDTNNFDYYDDKSYDMVNIDCRMFVRKLFGENITKIVEVDIDKISYEDLYYNNLTKEGYKEALRKLDDICNKE
jgi:nitrogen fixation-related uncharacterized protein